jgi:ubiquinone/menaquinone biosynthesis C-methylase UbiE
MNSDERRGNVEVYYREFYSRMMGHEAKGLFSVLWKYPHVLMEKPFKSNQGSNILELGCGEGEHIAFVKQDYSSYLATDIDSERLKRINLDLNPNSRVRVCDAEKLDFKDETFDRVIATCLLAHLPDPESALREWRRVTKVGGSLTIYVPCEPGFALRLFRRIFSAPKARKLGFEGFNLYISRDHRNDAFRLLNIAAEVFRRDRLKFVFRPFGVRSWYLNLFSILQITRKE